LIEAISQSKTARGSVQNALLALLAQRARHGYELRDLFEAALGGHWELNSGQIYSSLERLARDGLVVEEAIEKGGGPDKRVWALTEAGQQELTAWFDSPVPRDYRLRDEFYLKLMLALVAQPQGARHILVVQRRELFRELHDLTARRNLLDPKQQLSRILLLDSAIMHTEAELRWLDMVEVRLDDIRGQPPPIPPPRTRGRPKKVAITESVGESP
jgi:DNA-binding PadR family transcriptional regulator